jgi:hypothetical protein
MTEKATYCEPWLRFAHIFWRTLFIHKKLWPNRIRPQFFVDESDPILPAGLREGKPGILLRPRKTPRPNRVWRITRPSSARGVPAPRSTRIRGPGNEPRPTIGRSPTYARAGNEVQRSPWSAASSRAARGRGQGLPLPSESPRFASLPGIGGGIQSFSRFIRQISRIQSDSPLVTNIVEFSA